MDASLVPSTKASLRFVVAQEPLTYIGVMMLHDVTCCILFTTAKTGQILGAASNAPWRVTWARSTCTMD